MHPHDETLFVSGDYQGSIMFWHVNSEEPIAVRASGEQGAHEACIWSLAWHPLGTQFYSLYLLYWYKSTNTDATLRARLRTHLMLWLE
jgi:WD40 repeat protein